MTTDILTFNKVIYLYRQWSISKKGFINDFGYGPIYDFGLSRTMKYPAMWVDLQTDNFLTIANRVIEPTYTFNVLFVDQINIQQNTTNDNGYASDNREHIMSDTYQLGEDFIRYIMNSLGKVGLTLTDQVTATKVDDETQDKVCGWVFGISVKVRHYNCGTEAQILLGDFNSDYNKDYKN